MGIDEQQPQQQQQQQQHHHTPSSRHPHPIQRGASTSHPNHGLTLSLPLHVAASPSGKAPTTAPGRDGMATGAGVSVSVATTPAAAANGIAETLVPSTAGNGGGGGHGHGHGRDDCWSEGATNTLIEAWGTRYVELNRGNLKQKHWKDVADAVSGRENCSKTSKTDVQCKNRLDTLKKKYKLEKSRIFSNGGNSKWPFFNKLDELIGPSRKHQHHHQQVKPLAMVTPSGSKPIKRPPDEAPHMAMMPPVAINSHHQHLHMTVAPNSASSKSDETPDTTDSYPNGLDMAGNGKSNPFKKKKFLHDIGNNNNDINNSNSSSPFKELTGAILKFGEVYERVESSKLQQFMLLEKQRMEFIRDIEIQRMHLFMETQVELTKMKHGKHGNNTEHYL